MRRSIARPWAGLAEAPEKESAALLLNDQAAQHGTRRQSGLLKETVDVVGLTAEGAYQRARHVGIFYMTAQHPPQIG